MKTTELKKQLYEGLKESLAEFTDVIFDDTTGDVWSWATDGAAYESCPNSNAADALQKSGVAIIVCNCSKRKMADHVSCSEAREAIFPVLVLRNLLTPGAPDPQDVIDQVEEAVLKIVPDSCLGSWYLGETSEAEIQDCFVVSAVHGYVVGCF